LPKNPSLCKPLLQALSFSKATMLCALVKHTFTEVTVATENATRARCQSCPPDFWRGKSGTEKQGFDQKSRWAYTWQNQASIIGWMPPRTSASTHSSEQSGCANEGTCSPSVRQRHQRCSRHRPCKGKRLRSRKFMERLKTDIDDDVEFFNIQEVVWPPNLLADEKRRQHVIQRMEEYQQTVMCQKNSMCSLGVQSCS